MSTDTTGYKLFSLCCFEILYRSHCWSKKCFCYFLQKKYVCEETQRLQTTENLLCECDFSHRKHKIQRMNSAFAVKVQKSFRRRNKLGSMHFYSFSLLLHFIGIYCAFLHRTYSNDGTFGAQTMTC